MTDSPRAAGEPPEHESDPEVGAEETFASASSADAVEQVPAQRTSRLAIASTVLSVASIALFFPLLAIIGAGLGVVSLVVLLLLVAFGPDPDPAA